MTKREQVKALQRELDWAVAMMKLCRRCYGANPCLRVFNHYWTWICEVSRLKVQLKHVRGDLCSF